MTFREAIQVVQRGGRARLPWWNDESWIVLKEGRVVIDRGGVFDETCLPRPNETASTEWSVQCL